MVTHPKTSAHIVRNPEILSAEPIVAGTRVSVRTVVLMHRLYKDVSRVQEAPPHLSQTDIEEALAFYKNNRAEIDRYIQQNDVDEELLLRKVG